MSEVDQVSVAIASGASLSPEVDIGNKSLVGIFIPSNWSAATGGISFQVSPDSVNWYELLTVSGSAYSIGYTSAGAAYIAVDPATLRGALALKIRSGTSAAPVNQTNTVTLILITRLAV